MITVFLIFAACLLMNVMMIFYSQKQLKRRPVRMRQLTDEQILNNIEELAKFAHDQKSKPVNWNNEGF